MTTPSQALQKAINKAGSVAALARGIGITPWALSKWNVDRIPEERCEQIEKFTDGEVKAEELRPDINWNYVRSQKASA